MRVDQELPNLAYIVWLNDEWQPNDPPQPVEVYAATLIWGVTQGSHNLTKFSVTNISYGESMWDATNTRFAYGPAVAIYDEALGKCAWTGITALDGTAPSRLGDYNDPSYRRPHYEVIGELINLVAFPSWLLFGG